VGILTEHMKLVIRQQRLSYVATVCPDGTPNLSPKGTIAAWDDDHLMFADLRSPQTIKNLRQNPSIEVNVVDPILRKGYRFKGTAAVHRQGALWAAMLAWYGRDGLALEWNGRNRVRSIVLIEVHQALPLTSPAYDLGQSEEEVAARWDRYGESLRAQQRESTGSARESE